MRVTFGIRCTLAFMLSLSPVVAAAGTVDQAAWEAVDKTLGRPGRVLPGEVHRYGWPRSDLHVIVGGVEVAPTLALGSWAGLFKAGQEGHVMAMGDLVLLSDEVNPVIRALQAAGLDVLAIHNHLIGEAPQVVYVHFGGHAEVQKVASALRAALDATKTPLAAPGPAPSPSAAETAAFEKIQTVLGRKGTLAGHVLQVSAPRAAKIEEDGMEVPASAGMGTALNFQLVENRVATTGDFVLVAEEVNPVIHELQAHGIQVTALHSHMLRETPRLFFMHFWAVDDPARIAEGLKAALSKVAVQ
jgi:Domain of Unknown Function (DUF1259)